LLIATLRRRDLDPETPEYEAFLREPVPNRLKLLSRNCFGFNTEIDPATNAYRGFLRVMNKRNFAIHGNVDPLREKMETVYFEGKRPLFVDAGHHLMRYFEALERLHQPDVVRQDYEDVHAFLHEITTYLKPTERAFFDQVISDRYPGYEVKAKRITRILPNQITMTFLQGARYDDELNVEW
jgi:hypothetical protein